METCQHCGMYMKPFFSPATDAGLPEASCEFCGKTIAMRKDGEWYKLPPVKDEEKDL